MNKMKKFDWILENPWALAEELAVSEMQTRWILLRYDDVQRLKL